MASMLNSILPGLSNLNSKGHLTNEGESLSYGATGDQNNLASEANSESPGPGAQASQSGFERLLAEQSNSDEGRIDTPPAAAKTDELLTAELTSSSLIDSQPLQEAALEVKKMLASLRENIATEFNGNLVSGEELPAKGELLPPFISVDGLGVMPETSTLLVADSSAEETKLLSMPGDQLSASAMAAELSTDETVSTEISLQLENLFSSDAIRDDSTVSDLDMKKIVSNELAPNKIDSSESDASDIANARLLASLQSNGEGYNKLSSQQTAVSSSEEARFGIQLQAVAASANATSQLTAKTGSKTESRTFSDSGLSLDRAAFFEGGAKVALTAASGSTGFQTVVAEAGVLASNEVSANSPASILTQATGAELAEVQGSQNRLKFTDSANSSIQAKIPVPINQGNWGEKLGQQLSLLVSRNMEQAQIQLDPPELGPLQVKIQIQNDQVSLQFSTQHGMVKDAIEQTLLRLQQMFSEEGLDLVNVNVSDRESGQERNFSGNGGETAENDEEQNDEILTHSVATGLDDGKIDYFI